MDLLAQPLAAAKAELDARGIPYSITFTRPDRASFPLIDEHYYIIRHLRSATGEHRLLAAAKMGKEV